MITHAEIPESLITPTNNTYHNYTFDVHLNDKISTSIVWVVVFVYPEHRAHAVSNMYVEVWDKEQLMTSFKLSPTEPNVLPAPMFKKNDKGKCFAFKIDKNLLDKSWGAITINDAHHCIIKFADWRDGMLSKSSESILK